MNPEFERALERCDREIRAIEAQLRAGHGDIDGLTLALFDWSRERRVILQGAAESQGS